MKSREYIQKIADIVTDAGAQLSALANDPEVRDDPEKWMPRADSILESIEGQVSELPESLTS